jgi:hypothetical protein
VLDELFELNDRKVELELEEDDEFVLLDELDVTDWAVELELELCELGDDELLELVSDKRVELELDDVTL